MTSGYGVELSARERQQIAAMLNKGRESARVLRRGMVLRQLDQGKKIVEVTRNIGVSRKMVRAIRERYRSEGLESALHEKPRPGKQRALDVKQS